MKNFIQRLIGFSLGPILGAAISFFTVPLITSFVSPTEYGKASMFSLFQSIAITIIFFGIDQSYTREYYDEKNKIKLFQNAVIIPFFISLIMFFVIWINAKYFSFLLFESFDFPIIAVYFAFSIILYVFEKFILLTIRMEEKAIEYSFFSIFIKLTVFIVALVLILFQRRDFLTVVYSSIIGQVIGDLFLILRYKHLFNIKIFKYDKKLILKMLRFGFPLVFAASLASLLNSSDRLFLRLYTNFHEIGIYTATLKVVQVLGIIQTSFTSFWIPTAYRWHSEKKEMKYFEIISEMILLLMSVVFFLLIISKELVVSILSPEYIEAKYVIGLLCLSPILYTLSETTTLGIVFSRKSYLNIAVSLISIIPNIIINIIFTPILGTIGAGIATAISYILFFCARTYFSSKNGFKFPFSKHYLSIFLFFVCAILNTTDIKYLLLFNICLFISTLVIQKSTLVKLKNIIENPKEWDFN